MKMSLQFEDVEEILRHQRERDWHQPIRCTVRNGRISHPHFTSLEVYQGPTGGVRDFSVHVSEEYLEGQIQKRKNVSMNIGTYIRNMEKFNKSVQLYKYITGPNTTTYLTAPHFTLGLQQDTDGYQHVIKNEAPFTPVYVAVCTGEKAAKYEEHTNQYEALITKKMVTSDFRIQTVKAKSQFVVPQNSVYFVYAVTHSKFTVEYREPGAFDSSCSSATSDLEDSLDAAGPSVRRKSRPTGPKRTSKKTVSKKKAKSMEIRELKKKIKEQSKEIANLKKRKR